MKQLGNFITIATSVLLIACQSYKKSECNSIEPSYKLKPLTVTYSYDDGTSKTVTKYDTMRPKGKIYGCGKKYCFIAKYFNVNKEMIFKGKIDLLGSNKWMTFDDSQTEIKYNYYYTKKDSLFFCFKLKAYQVWSRQSTEGVVETGSNVWLHPMRYNQFVETEVMAFPEIYLPANIGREWVNSISRKNDSWGKWSHTENVNEFKIIGKVNKTIKRKVFECWVVYAKTKNYHLMNNDVDSSTTRLLFNETLGFVQISHKLSNQDSIAFDMYDYKLSKK
jgi:hypothetical protein